MQGFHQIETNQKCLIKCSQTLYCAFVNYNAAKEYCLLFGSYATQYIQTDSIPGTELLISQK